MQRAEAGSRSATAAALGWAALGTAACLLVASLEPNLLEEGILLHLAQRIAHGERLYRDVIAFTGPLPFQLLALLFRAFGEEIWVGRAAVALLHGAASGVGFAIARRAGAGALAHPAAAAYAFAPLLLFPLFGIFYYTTLAFQLSVLSVWAALAGSRRGTFLAGVGVAAVALCKQPIGAALALFAGLALALAPGRLRSERLAAVGAFAVGGLALAAATVAAFLAAGTLPDALNALLFLPASLEETFEAPFPNLWPPGVFAPVVEKSQTFYLPYLYILTHGIFVEPGWRIVLASQLLYAAPLVALAATLLRAVRVPLAPAAWLHAALLATWLVNLYPRTDWGHLVHVLPPALAQLCILLAPRGEARAARVRALALAAPILLLLVAGSGWAYALVRRAAEPVVLAPRVPLRPVSLGLRGAPVRRVIDFLGRHTRPGDPIFVARAEPLLYFATATRNPTPYPGVIPGMREEQSRVILEGLRDVRYVVMSDIDQPAMTFYRDELPAVQAHLERHFRVPEDLLVGEPHWLVVLERGPDRGATAIDLVERAASARAFRREAAGGIVEGPRLGDRLSTKYNRRPLGFELGERGGGLEFDLEIPPGALFQADAGMWLVNGQEHLYRLPLDSLVRVSIGQGDALVPIAEAVVMTREAKPFRWTPLEADLAAWAGEQVTLRIELLTKQAPGEGRLGYVGSPRIALRGS